MDILKMLLFPFSILYDLVTRIRNHLYNIGQKRSFRFQTMVISVGNLAAGGTGKTPMVEYILRTLLPSFNLSTLSRGYGRRTRGIVFASKEDNATTIGDEPLQFYKKFEPRVKVVVGEERAVAIPEILHRYPETDVIVLDDAFQHRQVVPQLSILLTEYQRPFYHDFVLPMGRLRESRREAGRADVIVVSKCPDGLTESFFEDAQKQIQKYSGVKPIFFSGLMYEEPVPFHKAETFKNNIILISGIAHANTFEEYARHHYNVLHHFKFGDHHAYTLGDLKRVNDFYMIHGKGAVLLTTEKDMVRLIDMTLSPAMTLPWFYLPIRIRFLKNGPEFDKIVLQSVEKSKKAG